MYIYCAVPFLFAFVCHGLSVIDGVIVHKLSVSDHSGLLMEFAIVEFLDDQSVAVIATNWLMAEDQCYWPGVSKAKALEKLVKARMQPASDWSLYSVRVLHKYGKFILIFV